MSVLKSFTKGLTNLAITNEDVLPVENIMLDIRIRGLMKCSPAQRRKSIIMGLPFAWLLTLLLFPFTALSYTTSFVISLAAAFIPFYIFELITLTNFFMLSLLFWALINYKPVYSTISKFIFDLLDFLSFGSLTELALFAHSTLSKNSRMDLLNSKNYFVVTHFYTTRQIPAYSYLEANWEHYFSSLATKYLNNKALRTTEVENYWKLINQPNNIYESLQPPSLEVPMDWTDKHQWAAVTIASITCTLVEMSDINELRLTLFSGKRTLLGAAVENGATVEIINMLLEAGADVNCAQLAWNDKDTFSILHLAVVYSSTEVVRLLMDAGVEIDEASGTQEHNIAQTAVLHAKQPAILREILLRVDDSILVDERGHTLLHYAAASHSDRSAFIELLVELGHDVNAKSNERMLVESLRSKRGGETPMLSCLNRSVWSIQSDGTINVQNIRCLVKYGADVNATTYDGSTALHILFASWSNPMECKEILLDHGADIEARDEGGETPLHYAARNSDAEEINFLIERGANVNAISEFGLTPAHTVCKRDIDQQYTFFSIEAFCAAVEVFLHHAADMTAMLGGTFSPLSILVDRIERGDFSVSDVPTESLLFELLNTRDVGS
ncbi:ankyrin repeat domain-containing protein [Pseudomonadales bacterium]|jgi:ankyrin repeat protein|nr:ankyrin repeat domain-containing protein [Pseudomonadales bacterium]